MKYFVILFSIAVMLFSSCSVQKQTSYNDDVYANPSADKIEEARLATIKKQKDFATAKRKNDSINDVNLAQKAKDDANPYYKDKDFKYDDYYDYEYATRVKRFNNNINGLSYYDNYYTNSYFYNQNPYNYGVSVYNGYSWWGNNYNNYSYNPSANFYNNNGWGNSYGYNNYNGYNPYMNNYNGNYCNPFSNNYGYGMPQYNPYLYNPYYGYGSGFGSGYGYNNPYGYGYNNYNNNGWGYYNGYDKNSGYTYGPRSSHSGTNARMSSNPGMKSSDDSYYNRYTNAIVEQQERTVKFADVPVRQINSLNTNSNAPVRNIIPAKQQSSGNVEGTNPIRTTENASNPIRNTPKSYEQPVRGNSFNQQTQEPVKQTPTRNTYEAPTFQQPVRQNEGFHSPSNSGGGNSQPSNSGGGNARPR